MIAGYLPAELDDAELDAIVDGGDRARPAPATPKDMGQVMKAVMAEAGGRADGKRASARGPRGAECVATRQ